MALSTAPALTVTSGARAGGSPTPLATPAPVPEYPVEFSESGLPAGSPWSVTLGGTTLSNATGGPILFSEPNGSYSYALTGPHGYSVGSPSSTGTVHVAGQPNTVVLPSIPTGASSNPNGLAYDPANGDLYVSNAFNNTVVVLNATTGAIVSGGIPVGENPWKPMYDPANGYIYVPNSHSANLTVIDGATNKVVVHSIGVGTTPGAIAYDPDNGELYVVNQGSHNVTVLDGATNAVTGPAGGIPTGDGPQGIVYDPANGYLYTANVDQGNVTVIDPANYSVVVGGIAVGGAGTTGPAGIAYDSLNQEIYVAIYDGYSVAVVNTTTSALVKTIPTGDGNGKPNELAFDPQNGYVYVSNSVTPGLVMVINGSTNTLVGSPITVGGNSREIAYDPANGLLYTANYAGADLTSLNGNGLLVTTWAKTPLYSVTFTESGLPSGTNWTVQINGGSYTSDTSSIVVSDLPAGSYAYTIGGATGYSASPGRGTVPVPATLSLAVAFSATASTSASITAWEWAGIGVAIVAVAAGVAVVLLRPGRGRGGSPPPS